MCNMSFCFISYAEKIVHHKCEYPSTTEACNAANLLKVSDTNRITMGRTSQKFWKLFARNFGFWKNILLVWTGLHANVCANFDFFSTNQIFCKFIEWFSGKTSTFQQADVGSIPLGPHQRIQIWNLLLSVLGYNEVLGMAMTYCRSFIKQVLFNTRQGVLELYSPQE